MRSSTRATFRPPPGTPEGAERPEDRHLVLGGVVVAGDDTMMNPPGSPAVESNRLGRVRPRGPIMSPTVDEIAIGKSGDARPERISADHRPGATRVMSDAAMLRSLDGILSRLPSTEMSVVASTRAVGWDSFHGVITAGRLEDFFRILGTLPLCGVQSPGRHDSRVEARSPIHAIPREARRTTHNTVRGGKFHPSNPAERGVQLLPQPGTFAVPRRARVENARADGRDRGRL